MSWGQDFLETFLGRLQRQDVRELMRDYHEDAELVAFDFVLKGKDAIRQYFEKGLIKRSGKILDMTMEAYFESDDMILFTMSVKSEKLRIVVARDALYVKNGKIFRHIALTLPPEKDKKICERI
jgi:hypothetical protein